MHQCNMLCYCTNTPLVNLNECMEANLDGTIAAKTIHTIKISIDSVDCCAKDQQQPPWHLHDAWEWEATQPLPSFDTASPSTMQLHLRSCAIQCKNIWPKTCTSCCACLAPSHMWMKADGLCMHDPIQKQYDTMTTTITTYW